MKTPIFDKDFVVLRSILIFFLLQTSLHAQSDIPLVISEIQKSMEKAYGVKFPIQNPTPEPPKKKEDPIPNKKKEEVKKVVKKPEEKRGLLEDDDTDYAKYDGVKKLNFKKKDTSGLTVKERMALKRSENASKTQSRLDAIRAKRKAEIDAKRPKASSEYGGDANIAWETSKIKEVRKWQEDKQKILSRWKKAQKVYKKRIPELKKDLTEIPFGSSAPLPKSTKAPSKESVVHVATTRDSGPLELTFIEEAFLVPIRDQGRRPTCAAFAAVRALEIVAKAKGKDADLSEQWFYFASKPDCQRSPCTRPGSWPRQALINSMNENRPDIPSEKDCPYRDTKKPGNETQIPLQGSCGKGVAKVESFSMVKSRLDIQERLRSGQPVIGGFKLSEDFFLNTGFVFRDPKQKLGQGIHAQGHAILLVGVMELPKELQKSQGKFCTLIANSWGEGWGRGGHACISDAWFDEFRYDMSFIALESLKI